MDKETDVIELDSGSDDDDQSKSSKTTSTIHMDENQFSVDGMIAEMIIEVDEPEVVMHSPRKMLSCNAPSTDQKPGDDVVMSYSTGTMSHNKEVVPLSTEVISCSTEAITDNTDVLSNDTETASGEVHAGSSSKESFAEKLGLESVGKDNDESPSKESPTKKKERVSKEWWKLQDSDPPKEKEKASDRQEKGKTLYEELIEAQTRKRPLLRKLPLRKQIECEKKEIASMQLTDKSEDAESSTLRNMPIVRRNIEKTKKYELKTLYRVIYDKWPPNNISNVLEEILQFSGFSFSIGSPEYLSRKKILNGLAYSTLQTISHIFGCGGGIKGVLAKRILKFLSHPSETLEPDKLKMKPVVMLKKINIDAEMKRLKDEPVYENKSKKRGRKRKLPVEDDDNDEHNKLPIKKRPGSSASKTDQKMAVSKVLPSRKVFPVKRKRVDTFKQKRLLELKKQKMEAVKKARKLVKGKSKMQNKSDIEGRSFKLSPSILESKDQEIKLDGFIIPRCEVQIVRLTEEDFTKAAKKSMADAIAIANAKYGPEMQTPIRRRCKSTFLSQPPKKQRLKRRKLIEQKEKTSPVSEDTDDASETQELDPDLIEKNKVKKMKEKKLTCSGVKLVNFPQIRKSINHAEKSVLQRLHVILYGTSDQPENMKKNILNFNGFPFEKYSDDWDSKKFILSLVATSMVREYIDLLHIHVPNDSPSPMIDRLMDFLMAPRSSLLNKTKPNEMEADGVEKTKIKRKKQQSNLTPHEKKAKSEVSKPTPKIKMRGKILMDEATLKKLELEIQEEIRQRKQAEREAAALRAAYNLPNKTSTVVAPQWKSSPSLSGSPNLRLVKSVLENDSSCVGNASFDLTPASEKVCRNSSTQTAPRQLCSGIGKLEECSHVKFMIVALHNEDLDLIHNFLYLRDGSKSRIRRNILEFDGFPFDEDSINYRIRLEFLFRIGIDLTRRISFILGLTPLKNVMKIHVLAKMVMRFLSSPIMVKQVPIRDFPPDFFGDFPPGFNKVELYKNLTGLEEVLRDESRLFPYAALTVIQGRDARYPYSTAHRSSDLVSDSSLKGKTLSSFVGPTAKKQFSPLMKKAILSASQHINMFSSRAPNSNRPRPSTARKSINKSRPSARPVISQEETLKYAGGSPVSPYTVASTTLKTNSGTRYYIMDPNNSFLAAYDVRHSPSSQKSANAESSNKSPVHTVVSSDKPSISLTLDSSSLQSRKIISPSISCPEVLESTTLPSLRTNEIFPHGTVTVNRLNSSTSSEPPKLHKGTNHSRYRQSFTLPPGQNCTITEPLKFQFISSNSQRNVATSVTQSNTFTITKSQLATSSAVGQVRGSTNPLLCKLQANARALVQSKLGSKITCTFQAENHPQVPAVNDVLTLQNSEQLEMGLNHLGAGSFENNAGKSAEDTSLGKSQKQFAQADQSLSQGSTALKHSNQGVTFLIPPNHPLLEQIRAGLINPMDLVSSSQKLPGQSSPMRLVCSSSSSSSNYRKILPLPVLPTTQNPAHEEILLDADEGEQEVPSDEDLFAAIRDIIHGSDPENLTLRMIIEKLGEQFPVANISKRRDFIKTAAKNIINGMTTVASS